MLARNTNKYNTASYFNRIDYLVLETKMKEKNKLQ